MKAATRCVHHGPDNDPYGSICAPLYQTATFRQPSAVGFGEYDYTRSGNPTRTLLQEQLAALEGGTYACAFASGMAAVTAVTRLVKSGEHIVVGADLYGGSVRLFENLSEREHVSISYVDTSDLKAFNEALTPQTRLVLIETPGNPLFRISDIRKVAEATHRAGAILAVDNSMLSPIFQQPLSLGADLVIHSATKFLCGHTDVIAGVVITNDWNLQKQIAFTQNAEGAALSPFDCWLLLRGLKTLALRVERQSESAARIAQFLKAHPQVKEVYYPAFAEPDRYAIQRTQATSDGAVMSFTTGDPELSTQIVESMRLFEIAVSFGSVGSTISLPCEMSHLSIPGSLRSRLGPPRDLVRLSVGIEDVDDLITDLEQAFRRAGVLSRKPVNTQPC